MSLRDEHYKLGWEDCLEKTKKAISKKCSELALDNRKDEYNILYWLRVNLEDLIK